MDLDWTQQSAGAVTLVSVRLRNERATDRRVRLTNCLAGPVLPPRREAVPEAGWDREGVATVVPAGETVALGYACPAPASTPPAAVEEVDAPDADEAVDPADAVRELGDHRPPRDVLGGDDGEPAETSDGEPIASSDRETSSDSGNVDATQRESLTTAPESFESYRARIETVEALSVASVGDAAELLDSVGGLDGVDALAAQLETDARELRAIATVADALADRAAAAAPPTEVLRGLS